jgi:hypothetical protein
VGVEIGPEPLPGQASAALASPSKPLQPDPFGPVQHELQGLGVAVHPEVALVTEQPPAERGVLILKREVPVTPTPLAEADEGPLDARLACLHAQTPTASAPHGATAFDHSSGRRKCPTSNRCFCPA